MRTAILTAALLLIADAIASAQTEGASRPAPRVANVPEIIERPLPQETPQERVLRLEAELNEARQDAGPLAAPSAAPLVTTPSTLAPPTAGRPTVIVDDSWRYKQVNGTWWYLQPNNRWVYWYDGHWVDYVPHVHVVPSYHHHYPHYDYHGPSIGIFFGHGHHGHHHHGHHHHSHHRHGHGHHGHHH